MPEHTQEAGANPEAAALAGALTFHAGFDHGPHADFGSGDRRIYTAEVREEQHIVGLTPGPGDPPVAIAEGRGTFGAALEFTPANSRGQFVGLVDDLALFNRALSAAEVRVLYGLKRGVAELHE